MKIACVLLPACFATIAEAGWGHPSSGQLEENHNSNEDWGQEWVIKSTSEGPTYECNGRTAYGRGYNDGDWAFRYVSGKSSGCGHWMWPFKPIDPSPHNHDKQCVCQTLKCRDGQQLQWDGNVDSRPYCKEAQIAPTRMKTCLDLIVGVEGGSSGQITRGIQKQVGSTSSSSISKTQRMSIADEVSAKVSEDFVFENLGLDATVKTSFESCMESAYSKSSSEEYTYTFNVTIDLSKPCYWYRSTIEITTEGAGYVNLEGDSMLFLNHEFQQPCTTVSIPPQLFDNMTNIQRQIII